jgi:hypothetical protein
MSTLVFGAVFLVLEQMRTSSSMVVLVPTEGGLPILNLGELRRNLRQP